MKFYVAREKDNSTRLFTSKPYYHDGFQKWVTGNPYDFQYDLVGYIPDTEFQELTFENSPKEVKIKLI